ncbi:MAG TPA: hypothetical protein VGX51_05100 [Solirubrobacteraceae bacterium]|jgi:uncharacterized membrane protein YraQ (UPF0718 family)|nr:hypothetical protein [Solirubrobacteraceae bacterium]
MSTRVFYIAYRFLKEALHRAVGLNREASVITTGFTLGVLGAACEPLVAPLVRTLRRKPAPPSAASSFMGLAVLRHLARGIGGEPLNSRPVARWVIVGAMLRPALEIALLPVHVVEAALGELAKAWRYVTVGVAPRRSR